MFWFVWASPPCTEYSIQSKLECRRLKKQMLYFGPANNGGCRTFEPSHYVHWKPTDWIAEETGLFTGKPYQDVDCCKCGMLLRKRTQFTIWLLMMLHCASVGTMSICYCYVLCYVLLCWCERYSFDACVGGCYLGDLYALRAPSQLASPCAASTRERPDQIRICDSKWAWQKDLNLTQQTTQWLKCGF